MHGDLVIGTAVPASFGRQVTKDPISAGRQWKVPSGLSGASREEAPEELIFLKRDAAPTLPRKREEQSGTQEWSTQEGPRNIGRFWPSGQAPIVERQASLRVAQSTRRSGSSFGGSGQMGSDA